MPEFIVHIHRDIGWHTETAVGDTFAEAAVKGVQQMMRRFSSRDILGAVPHTAEYKDDNDRPRVIFTETSIRKVFGGYQHPGDIWFSEQVRQGKPDDCPKCGGTGTNHYYSWLQCWGCGNPKSEGKGTGKRMLSHRNKE